MILRSTWVDSDGMEEAWEDSDRLPALQLHLARIFQMPWPDVTTLLFHEFEPATCALVASACPNVRELNYQPGCADGSVAMCAPRLPRLEKLYARYSCLGHVELSALATCSALTALTFEPLMEPYTADAAYLQTLWSLTTLQHLDAPFRPRVSKALL